ncbi:MAG: hypothetical protein HY962_17665 [Ignavibacteriae bacterium]|nr:hypothetical protein [Ignavibacteriota bacterium]
MHSIVRHVSHATSLAVVLLITTSALCAQPLQWTSAGVPELGAPSALAVDEAGSVIAAAPFGGGVLFKSGSAAWSVHNEGLTDLYVNGLVESKGTWYASTSTSGVFRSIGTAGPWTRVAEGLPAGRINSIGATKAGTIVALTQDSGLFALPTGSTTWRKQGTGFPSRVNARFATSGSRLWAGTSSGVFMSTNEGNSWENRSTGLGTAQTDYGITVTASGALIVGSWASGAYRSTDDGATWVLIDSAGNGPKNIRAVAANGSGDALVASTQGLFVSSDNGAQFTRLSTSALWGVYLHIEALSGRNFMGWSDVDGLWQGGVAGSWTRNADGFIGARIYALRKDPSSDRIWIGSNYGWLFSMSLHSSWERFSDLQMITSNTIDDILVATSGTVLLAGSGGVYRGRPPYTAWSRVMRGSASALLLASDGKVYCGTDKALRMSPDTGLTWTTIDTLLSGGYGLCFAELRNGDVLAGISASPYGRGVRRRDRTTGLWSQFGSGLDTTTVSALCVLDGVACAGTWGRGVFIYDTVQNAWRSLGTGIPNLFINDLVAGNSGELYAATWGGGVGRILPRAANPVWDPVNTGLPNLAITAMTLGMAQGKYWLYAGTQGNSVFAAEVPRPASTGQALVPAIMRIGAPLPHPARGTTLLSFTGRTGSPARLTIWDQLGRLVMVLYEGVMTADIHTVRWNTSQLDRGSYVIRLEQNGTVVDRSCIVE